MTEQILQSILQEIRQQNSSPDALWDAADIATYMKLAKSTVQSRIICSKGFPRALRVPSSDNGGGRRWLAKEVKQWVLKFREPARH